MIHSIWHKYIHVPKIRHVITCCYTTNYIINLSFPLPIRNPEEKKKKKRNCLQRVQFAVKQKTLT